MQVAWLAHAAEKLGRFLLVLAAVELISMPLTQYAWTWDHFLHGGMDFESSLLFFVVCLGLLLVLRHHCRQDENLRVPRWRLSLPIFDTDKSAAMLGIGPLLAFDRERRSQLPIWQHSTFLFRSDPASLLALLLDGSLYESSVVPRRKPPVPSTAERQ